MWCMKDRGPPRGNILCNTGKTLLDGKLAKTALSYSILAGCHAYSCWVPVAPKVIARVGDLVDEVGAPPPPPTYLYKRL